MKPITLVLLTISIVFIVIGYMELKISAKQKEKVIEYRFIPRSILEEQIHPVNLERSFYDMFENDPFTYRDYGLVNTNLV